MISSPALFTAAEMATEPSVVAGTLDREPWNPPIGVRAALAITTSCIVLDLEVSISHRLQRSKRNVFKEVSYKYGFVS